LPNAQQSCRRKRAGNFVDTVRNQKDSPWVAYFFLGPNACALLCTASLPIQKKKPAHPGDKNARATGFKIFCAFPRPRNGLSSYGLALHHTEAFSTTGEAYYERTNITWKRSVNQVLYQDPLEMPHQLNQTEKLKRNCFDITACFSAIC
jgi:hypothetical protein